MSEENVNEENNNANESCPACSEIKTMRSEEEYKSLMNRLCRVEGQIRGIKKMLENNAYCPDILIQASAANAALNSFSKELLTNHLRSCVMNDAKEGKTEKLDELVNILQKMMK